MSRFWVAVASAEHVRRGMMMDRPQATAGSPGDVFALVDAVRQQRS
ncbi:hypothetical protein [Mangrovitalea sediminis]|nr:hypothetical protein [Mangrovitalea sediminis]